MAGSKERTRCLGSRIAISSQPRCPGNVQTFPVLDTNWIIAGVPGSEFDEEGYQYSSQNDGTDIIYGETPTEDWKLKSFECKAQASVCCSEENHLGPDYIHNPSILKSCAASSFPPPPPVYLLSPFQIEPCDMCDSMG